LERCAITGEEWLTHQSLDDYWRDTGVAGRVDRIQCAVMAVSGWADPGFAAAMLRVLAQARAPRRGLIGPWSHRYAHVGLPGPAIGYLQETLRWLDHWLKGADTGVMGDPALRVWVPEAEAPNERPTEQAGRWVGLSAWPAPETRERGWALNPGRLDDAAGPAAPMTVRWHGEIGEAAGEWMPIFTTGANPEMAGDQRGDDGRSLCFDSAPLGERIEFVGAPVLELEVSADRPIATLAARLCDVAPDGASRRVSFGALNLVHRDGADRPALAEPGRRYRVRFALYDAAYAFPPGHRIRLALSTSSWPMIWPSPTAATVTVTAGSSRMALPVLRGGAAARVIGTPETAPPVPMTMRRPMSYERRRGVDAEGRHVLDIREDFGATHYGDIDIEADEIATRRTSMRPDDPATASVDAEARWQLTRGAWRVGGSARTRVTGDGGAFAVDTRLEAREGDATIFSRDWRFRVPRRFV
jgi:putative CocE/NonD family hydrolase